MSSLGIISDWKAILPIIVLFVTTIASFCTWHTPHRQRWITLIGTGVLFYVSILLLMSELKHGIMITYLSNWDAPYGIILMIDTLSAIMLVLTSLIGFCVALFSITDIRLQEVRSGFYPAFSILLIGLCGGFLTGDLFNLYVWFEVTVIASFVMMVCGNSKRQLEATIKYVILNLIATLLLLTAIALIYGMTGTLNMANIAQRLPNVHHDGIVTAASLLLLIAFGMKAGLFPLFFWLPASYHTSTFSSSAMFAGLLSKLGVYALFRVVTMMLNVHAAYLHQVLLSASLLTLIVGILGALSQTDIRRIFSFTLISHVGFMVLGLALYTPLAIVGGLFYLIQHVLVMVNLFFISGVGHHLRYAVKKGAHRYPLLSALFFVLALTLSGIPPLSGFWGELTLLTAAFQARAYLSIFVIILVSVLTLWVMVRLWFSYFYRASLVDGDGDGELYGLGIIKKTCLYTPMIILFIGTMLMSFYPKPFFLICDNAAKQLLSPGHYVHLIIGDE
jgi:multicomponent Na+:H+ antiporter subunit D